MQVASFGDEFLGATVDYSEKAKFEHMRKVTSITMAKEFVKLGKKTHGKQRI